MSIETHFDIAFIAAMARREKQIQQNYRPIIAVHKWFARRPGTLFRGLTLAEFGDGPLSATFFAANDFAGRTIADPFMGGGTPLLEANRVGCDVLGVDINPMAAWVVREELEHLDPAAYRRAADTLVQELAVEVGDSYVTDCPLYGDSDVPVKYFLWVKTTDCEHCGAELDLFPGYLVAGNARHPKHVVLCANCGDLTEVADRNQPGACRRCASPLAIAGPARRQRCTCHRCGHAARYPRPEAGPPRHRLFAIEYYNPDRRSQHRGRFFKKPDERDLARYAAASARWAATTSQYVPEQRIPPGDETDRLHRWGYRCYRELFNPRQLLGLELSARRIAAVDDQRIRHALATNLSDLLRYQNMLCRYDTTALKSLDVFSVHGFPAGLVQCESNLLGITTRAGVGVGSGGWSNIIAKYEKAKRFCDAPFEVDHSRGRKTIVPVPGEWIGARHDGRRPRRASIRCASSTALDLAPNSLDAVFTDPPYFGNVQYGELMDFCYVWLRRLVGSDAEGFSQESTRSPSELTGNATQDRDLEHFTEGLAAVYRAMARALKPGAPLAFTFHHNRDGAVSCDRRRDPRRRTHLLRVHPLPCGNGRLDSHPRNRVIHRRHHLRVPRPRSGPPRRSLRRSRWALHGGSDRSVSTSRGGDDAVRGRYPVHRLRPPHAHGSLVPAPRLGFDEAHVGAARPGPIRNGYCRRPEAPDRDARCSNRVTGRD